MPPKTKEPKPTPVLRFATAEQTHRADTIRRLLDEALAETECEGPGASAKMAQFLSAMINPRGTAVIYRDHEDRPRSVPTFSTRVARQRQAAFDVLRDDEGLSGEAIGDLVGLVRTSVQAAKERSAGTRAQQKRISLADAARLEQAKALDRAPAPAPERVAQ
jgi:hypothetical protein